MLNIRGQEERYPELYQPDPSRYTVAQAWGLERRREGDAGVVYSSVRRAGGQCAALFRPKAISDCRIIRPLHYLWNGARIVGWA